MPPGSDMCAGGASDVHHARITAGALLVGAAFAACRERPADQPRSAVARCGNRIAKGRFTLDARTDHLTTDNGANQLNGGVNGFDKALWRGEANRPQRCRRRRVHLPVESRLRVGGFESDPSHKVKLIVDEWGAWHAGSADLPPNYLWAYPGTLRDALARGPRQRNVVRPHVRACIGHAPVADARMTAREEALMPTACVRPALQRLAVLIMILLLLLLLPAGVAAQVRITGAIAGLVVDASDAVVPGARVQLVDEGTGVAKEATTSESGSFLFPDLS